MSRKRAPVDDAPKRKRRPLLAAFLIALAALALTADERVFGLLTDGQMITRTAFSMTDLHELGIARGHRVGIARPQGDAVTRYGLLPSLAQTAPMLAAEPLERSGGPGASQTLFVAEQIAFLLLAALSAGLLARAWGATDRDAARALLACAVASPLAAYAGSDFSEPLQAALVGAAFLFAALAVAEGAAAKRVALYSVLAGATAGLALLAKSFLVLLLPCVLVILAGSGEKAARVRRALLALAGFAPVAGIWLAFEIARFGRPFASYRGERFSNPPLDGLWRLTIGPNKGLLLYFPLAALAVVGLALLWKRARVAALVAGAFAALVLVATAAWWAWDGTAGWGPRLLLPLIPLLAALAVLSLPRIPATLFWVLFGVGVAVNALGVFEPDALTTWYVTVLPKRAMTPAEAARYPDFAYEKGDDGVARLYPIHDVARHAAFSPIRLAAWLLHTRLAARDVKSALATPPWDTSVPGRELAVPPDAAIPRSAMVFLTSKPRWPHLGMSLTRGSEQLDTALAYVDSVYDQALRAQDMGRTDRAAEYGERLYRLVPGPQTAVALVEGLRLAGRRDALAEWLKTIPKAHAASPEFGFVLALYQRDLGDEAKAKAIAGRVAARDPRFAAIASQPVSTWPARLRDVTRPAAARG